MNLLLAVAVRPRIRYIVSVIIFIAVVVIPIIRPMGIPFRGPPTSGGEVPFASNLTVREPLLNNVALHDSPAWPAIHEFQARLEVQMKSWRGRVWVRALPGIWGLIILMLAARELIGYSKWRRARRTWQVAPSELREFLNWPVEVPLYLHPHEGPSTFGCLRPFVVLPARLFSDLTPEDAQRIAKHELAHVRWKDPLVNVLLRLFRSLLWTNPMLWYLGHVMRVEQEAAADRAAIDLDENRSCDGLHAYVTSLVTVAKWVAAGPSPAFRTGDDTDFLRGLRFEGRIQRLLRLPPMLARSRTVLAVAALIVGIAAIPLVPHVSYSVGLRSSIEENRLASNQEGDSFPSGSVFVFALDQPGVPLEIDSVKSTEQYAYEEVKVKNLSDRTTTSVVFGILFSEVGNNPAKPVLLKSQPIPVTLTPGEGRIVKTRILTPNEAAANAGYFSPSGIRSELRILSVRFLDGTEWSSEDDPVGGL